MDIGIDARQTERVLSQLARLRHHCGPEEMDALESLRPAWLGANAWDVVLDDLEAQCYREHAPAPAPAERPRTARLQLIRR